ncbi:MAG TPA: carboxypeptidase regulatory-like domain-containing protein [Longimicrobiales bacterium]|nr:carboxypeptidase regulatory-like domain-containing protein [Longimicrobiales bacterium]
MVACCLIAPAQARGQTGSVTVRVTGPDEAPLPAVLVELLADGGGVVRADGSDAAGRVRFAGIPSGRYAVRAQRLGYGTVEDTVRIEAGRTAALAITLREAAVGLPGVIVEAARRRARFEETAGATAGELTQRELKLVPAVGEADVLRAIEILPGVVSTSDFSSAFNVRGGSADQNLILLDGIPVYNPFHLGGLFSIFNADMVALAELHAGGFPAEHGGRVASVLRVESDAGGPGTTVDAGVSLLAARVAVGRDVPDGWLSGTGLRSARGRVSLRRSYFDQVLGPFFDFPYHFTDLQVHGEAWTAAGGRLVLTGYTGRDVLDLAGTDSFPLQVRWGWGNDVVGATWASQFRGGGTLQVRAGHSRFTTGIRFPEFRDTDFRARINQSLVRLDATFPAGAAVVGTGAAVDRLSYANRAETGGAVFADAGAPGSLAAAYVQVRMDPADWLLEAGIRGDAWLPHGSDAVFVAQPRVAAKRFLAGGTLAVKLAVGRYAQFVHSLRDEDLPLGIDVWVLAGARAPHVVSDQVQAGIEGYVGASWFGAVEAYYRSFDGVVATNAADDPDDPDDDLLRGRGRGYGADFHLRRERGRIRPMLAVSWLRATREFDDVFAGLDPPQRLTYAPIFDRRLDVDLVVQAMLPRDVELGIRWNLGTGLPYTRPLGAHVYYEYSSIDGGWRAPSQESDSARSAIVLGPRNAERYPPYHRLDVGLRRTYRKRWGTLTPHVDVLNVYNRRNVLFYFYQYDETPPTRAGLSMFPILPTAGLEVRF